MGMETKRTMNRGPVGIEGLMTSKWLLKGKGHVTQVLPHPTPPHPPPLSTPPLLTALSLLPCGLCAGASA